MRKLLLFSLATLIMGIAFGQKIDSVDTQQHRLDKIYWPEGVRNYLVCFQDSLGAPFHDLDVWKRTRTTSKSGDLVLQWERSMENRTYVSYQITARSQSFVPIDEQIYVRKSDKENNTKAYRKHFIYEGNRMYTDTDTTQHNVKEFQISDLMASLNWEMDMETFSMLPLAKGKAFAINFYHPGSTSEPEYYLYKVVRQEQVIFDGLKRKCWVLEIDYDGKGTSGYSDFWIDKKTKEVLKMCDRMSNGGFRYKFLLPK